MAASPARPASCLRALKTNDQFEVDCFMQCIAAHAAFHREAAFVAEIINRERIDDPTSLLRWNGELSQASKLLVIRLKLLGMRKPKTAGPVMSMATSPRHRRHISYKAG